MNFLSKGVVSGIAAALSFSLMILFVKLAKGIPAQETIFFRSIFTLIASVIVLKQQGLSIWGQKENKIFLLGRGLAGYVALSAYFFSVRELPIAVASLVQYMSPVFSAIFAFLFLREDSSFRQWLCLLVGFIGIGFISGVIPNGNLNTSTNGVYWISCLFSAILSGVAYVFVRKLTTLKESPEVIIFYFPLVSIPFSLVSTINNWVLPSFNQWIYLLGVCVYSYLGQIFLTYSLKMERTAAATNTLYLGSVFATIWGISFLSEIPSWNFYIGALLIIGCQLLFGRKK
ncbi:MAG: DMT family transporter [Candidatus Caenarcaniphilales bacterium]|nr:DMT family transporter [Candidatus Caenarcaniphilales bacterium]